MMRASLAAILSISASYMEAAPFLLDIPVDCELGKTCFIQQYVDHARGPEVSDYTCAGLSYDGHKGTDFGLPTLEDMYAGVPVIAAAAGTVRGVRDGVPDQIFEGDDLGGRDCGNGVVISHGDDWETQYCHLLQGSVIVRKGQKVKSGTQLGLIGLSGRTQFPHLHLSVRRRGAKIDPFAPRGAEACGSDITLWRDPPPYEPGALLDVGFADRIPDYDSVKSGEADDTILTTDTEAMVGFGYAYGGQAGDVLQITITGPSGEVISHEANVEKNQALFFRAAGRKRPRAGWPEGDYSLHVEMLRNGAVISRRVESVEIR